MNVLKFFFGYIPIFDGKIAATENKVDDTPSNPKRYFSTSVPFKILITQHQYKFSLRHMAQKMIWVPVKK